MTIAIEPAPPDAPPAAVAVAIVGYRNPDDVLRCLAALAQATWTDFEVVICENGGAVALSELQARAPAALARGQRVRILSAGANLGFAGGVNVCLRASPAAQAWWVLNPDTAPHPDALRAKMDRLQRGDCDAVGCTLYRADGTVQSHGGRWRPWLARAESIGIGEQVAAPPDPQAIERSQAYLNGAAMLMTRRFVETVGLMREDYFLYCEEVEWCLRGRRKGLRLGYAPGAKVLHLQGTTTGAGEQMRSRPRMPIHLGERNRVLLTRDLFPGRLAVAAPAALATLILRYGRRRAWRQLGWGIAGWWAGVVGERGAPDWLEPTARSIAQPILSNT